MYLVFDFTFGTEYPLVRGGGGTFIYFHYCGSMTWVKYLRYCGYVVYCAYFSAFVTVGIFIAANTYIVCFMNLNWDGDCVL